MVGPVAKREAVAHLRSVLEMSERRACTLVAADRTMIRYRSRRPPDTALGARLRSWPMNDGASATGACSSCYAGRARHQGSTGSTGSIATRG